MPFYLVVLYGILLLLVLGWIYRKRALKHVTYERYFSHSTAYEGDRIQLVERIANRKALPVPWLRLESLLSRDLVFGRQANFDVNSGEKYQNHLSLFSLRPYRQIVRRHEVLCSKRGVYTLPSATMTAGEPLGLVHVVKRFPLSLTLLVFPREVPYPDLPLPSHSWLGDLTVKRWIVQDPFLTAGVREYQSGDSFRSVNWKATARTGSMQVHRRDHTADHHLIICLNFEVTASMWNTVTQPERIELGIRYAATIAGYAISHGIETGLLCNGWEQGEAKIPVHIPPMGGALQHEQLLASLAKLELESAANMDYMLDRETEAGTTQTDFLIITCHRGDKLTAAAERIRRLGNGVDWLDIPEERGGISNASQN
jgi:uncharacterized protein (DUF58 family)